MLTIFFFLATNTLNKRIVVDSANKMALRRESPLLLQFAAALLLLLVAILHTAPSVSALSCPSKCDPSWCIVNVSECQYGTVLDVCGCCHECAKGPGEKCGGTWGIYGACSNDSVCLVTVKFGATYTEYLETIGYCRLSKYIYTVCIYC